MVYFNSDVINLLFLFIYIFLHLCTVFSFGPQNSRSLYRAPEIEK